MRENLRLRVEEELRKRRTRMSFEELLQSLQPADAKAEENKASQALRRFVEKHGYMDHQGEGFLGVLKQTQQYLGPYSIKMAHDHLKQVEAQKQSPVEGISFVRMEYFLYAVTEAHRCVTDLRQMEARINEMQDEVDLLNADLGSAALADAYQRRVAAVQAAQHRLDQLQYQIASKESELVLLFRELMSWDYNVPPEASLATNANSST